jgi:hypothetical protein
MRLPDARPALAGFSFSIPNPRRAAGGFLSNAQFPCDARFGECPLTP